MFYLSVAAGAYYFFKVPARSVPAGNTSRRRMRAGAARILNERFRLLDDSRAALPPRQLAGEIWRPARSPQGAPLVIYSHGYMSYRRESLYLLRFLASHGYNVVAVDYPLTGRRARGKPQADDIVNQPGDISCVIDYLLERNSDPADRLFECIDPDKIALAGLSYGGLTSLLATYHREWRDPRVTAVVSIAGASSMLSRDFYAGSDTPALLIYGDSDSLVHHDDHALTAFEHIDDVTLVSLKRGSHTGFSQPASTLMRFLKNPDSLGCAMLRMNIDDRPWDFVAALGGEEVGVVDPAAAIGPLTQPLIPVAMKAARQQMFTSLAAHAFLESRFANSQPARQRASRYLHQTLEAENAAEVVVQH